jgi:hypothetical protein
MWIQVMATLVILAPPALAQRGVIESVTPGSRTVETGQSLGLTVRGVNPCGAVEIDPGDGSAPVLPISHLPATVTITLRKPGQYTIRAKGRLFLGVNDDHTADNARCGSPSAHRGAEGRPFTAHHSSY